MMLLSRSLGRKIVATGTAAVAFAFLYEATILDSRYAARAELRTDDSKPVPGAHVRFTATAYCRGTTTASGVNVRNGIAAADPDLLPVGSVIQVDRLGDRYNGIYTVMDTGPAVQGRHIDIYMWNCDEARYEFGRRSAGLTVLRLGWNPRATTPSLIDRLFRRREAAQPQDGPAARPGAEATPGVREEAQKAPGG
jgi:3D (Asp-Asp-Asp) domain-containing protein